MKKEAFGFVDVVIPTYHPDGKFLETLKSLREQTVSIGTIYVINTRSDYFPEEVRQMAGVKYVEISPQEFDHGNTRDLGMQMSEAPVVVFLTQDAVPQDARMLEELLYPFQKSDKIALSYGRQLPFEDCNEVEKFTRTFNYPETSMIKSKSDLPKLGIKTFFCSDVCAAYARDIYLSLGGFVKKAIFNEDMIYGKKAIEAGYLIAYCAKARVLHSHNYSGWQQFQRNFDLGVSQAEYPEVFEGISSEKEGKKLVNTTLKYLGRRGKWYLIPRFFYHTSCKYAGYLLGKRFRKLPTWFILFCSGSSWYWKKGEK